MKFIALIYSAAKWEEASSEEFDQVMAAYAAFEEKHAKHINGGEALHPVESATSVRVRGGDVAKTDGPFAETKEVLGGFYMLDCDDIDHAVAIAAEIPGASEGTVEVRPILEMPES